MSTYEYSYSTTGNSGVTSGVTSGTTEYKVVEYTTSSASDADAVNSVLLSTLGGSSGSGSAGTVYVSGGGLSSGGSTIFVSGGGAGAGAGAGSGAGSAGASNATVNQIASDLLSLGAGAGASAGAGAGSVVTFGTGGGAGAGSIVGFGGSTGFGYGGGSTTTTINVSGGGSSGTSLVNFVGGGGSVLEASAYSAIEQAILRANNPLEFNETEVITVNGQTGIWANKNEVINWRGVIPITQYLINEDTNPEVIRKHTDQLITYEQEVAIRYLRPPTPPPPGEILIRQEKNIITPPAPPLVIRQQPPRPETPQPLVLREAPPRPPAAVGQKVITISGKRLPPPPRKVIIERLAPLPSKPQSVIIERWLPYKQAKRRVIFQRPTESDPVIPKPKNVIVQWDAPQVQIRKEFRDLGVIRANPVEYVQRYGSTLKTHIELPQFVKEIRPPTGVVLAAEYQVSSLYDLEGDVQALSLIDLDREGLGEYRSFLSRYLSIGGGSGSGGSIVIGGGSGSGGSIVIGGGSGSGGSVVIGGGGAGSGGSIVIGSGSGSGGSIVIGGGSSGSIQALIAELFQAVDRNASGQISRSEAEKLLLALNSRLGRSYGENEVNIFFRTLDVNADGLIDFQEFRNAILRQFVVV